MRETMPAGNDASVYGFMDQECSRSGSKMICLLPSPMRGEQEK
jgi:hypothetical protein